MGIIYVVHMVKWSDYADLPDQGQVIMAYSNKSEADYHCAWLSETHMERNTQFEVHEVEVRDKFIKAQEED